MTTTTKTRDRLATASLQMLAGERMADDPANRVSLDGYDVVSIIDMAAKMTEGLVDSAARAHVAALDAEAAG